MRAEPWLAWSTCDRPEFARPVRSPGEVTARIGLDGRVMVRLPEQADLVGVSLVGTPVVDTILHEGTGVTEPSDNGVRLLRLRKPAQRATRRRFCQHRPAQGGNVAPAEDAFGNHLTRLAIAVLVVMIAAWVGTDLLIRQNTDANKVLVRRLYDGFSTGGVDLLDEVVAEGFIDHDQCPTNPPDWLDSNRRLDRSGMHSRTERWWSKILWQRATG